MNNKARRTSSSKNEKSTFKKSDSKKEFKDNNKSNARAPRFSKDRNEDKPYSELREYKKPSRGFASKSNDKPNREKPSRDSYPTKRINNKNVKSVRSPRFSKVRDEEKPYSESREYKKPSRGFESKSNDKPNREKPSRESYPTKRINNKNVKSVRSPRFSKVRDEEKPYSESREYKKPSRGFASKSNDRVYHEKPLRESFAKRKPYADKEEKEFRKSRYADNTKDSRFSHSRDHKKPFDKKKSYGKDNFNKKYKDEDNAYEHMKFEWPIRLNRYISNAGICARREADKLIVDGLVTVNGTVVTELGSKVNKRDIVKYKGNKILPEKPIYILMNKPKNYITSTKDESDRQTVMDLISDEIDVRVYPIGRLDRKTSGVLLLTNDGELAQKLTHPAFEVKKIYEVTLEKEISNEELAQLADGIELEDGFIHADEIALANTIEKNVVGIEIHSGKNRIVRRMFEHIGHTVVKLDRVMFGPFTKKGVERGKYRFLKNAEIAQLKRAKKKLS